MTNKVMNVKKKNKLLMTKHLRMKRKLTHKFRQKILSLIKFKIVTT